METTQDQLEFTGIGIDIAYRVHTWYIGTIICRIDHDRIFVNFQTPVPDRTEFGTQAKQRQPDISQVFGDFVRLVFDYYGIESIRSFYIEHFRIGDYFDLPYILQDVHFGHRIEMAPKIISPMDQGNRGSYFFFRKIIGPVES